MNIQKYTKKFEKILQYHWLWCVLSALTEIFKDIVLLIFINYVIKNFSETHKMLVAAFQDNPAFIVILFLAYAIYIGKRFVAEYNNLIFIEKATHQVEKTEPESVKANKIKNVKCTIDIIQHKLSILQTFSPVPICIFIFGGVLDSKQLLGINPETYLVLTIIIIAVYCMTFSETYTRYKIYKRQLYLLDIEPTLQRQKRF